YVRVCHKHFPLLSTFTFMDIDFGVFLTGEGLISLLTLSALEIVLGIDNLIFISILTDKLPEERRPFARNLGLALALVVRVAMLFGITWIMSFQTDLFNISDLIGLDYPTDSENYIHLGINVRDLILLAGGLFLIGKSVSEIHEKITYGIEEEEGKSKKAVSVSGVIFQIVLIDIVFSFDSILTAVGLVEEVIIMVVAVLISMALMIAFVKSVSEFIDRNPPLKILALSFLILIGFLLASEALGQEVSKGYVYFAMAFAFIVELLNMRVRKKRTKEVTTTLSE
ncbi:MAG: TerC family protein, partial [Bacteroidota bacterium]